MGVKRIAYYNSEFIHMDDVVSHVVENGLLEFEDIEQWLFEEVRFIKNPPLDSKSEDWKIRTKKMMKLLNWMIEALKPTITYAEFKVEPSDEQIVSAILEP